MAVAPRVDAAFILDKGEPATGTKIQLESEDLLVGLLDQEAVGVGGLSVSITDIDENQVKQINLQGRITDISITHSGQDRPHVEEVDLVVSAIGSGKKLTDSLSGLVADIDVSNARVTDWSAYNRYFPENGGLEFIDGEGELNASIQLSEKNTRADINLVARDLKMVIRDEHVKGDFSLDVPLRNGNLKTQSYDVGGALLQLERFGIDGAGEAENWSGRAYVESGRVRWRSPLQLKSDVTLRLDDSGPLVKLFSPDPKEHRWMQNLLSVKDVSGSAQIGIDDRSLVLNAVEIGGEDLGFLGKLRFQDNAADGIVYARYKGFHAAVEFRQGKRKWKIIGAKKHYDDYPPFAIEAVE